jgi:anti-sigma factor RsiW
MTCDLGALRAYLDDEDLPAEHAAMAAHLAGCAPCRDELESLRQQSLLIDSLLPELEPSERIVPEPEAALAQFRRSQAEIGTAGLYQQLRGWVNMIGTSFSANWRRRAFVGASALAVLLVLFSFAPVRQAAADFLGIFRVRKFAVIPIDPRGATTRRPDALAGRRAVRRQDRVRAGEGGRSAASRSPRWRAIGAHPRLPAAR